jgi:hypothetical protein
MAELVRLVQPWQLRIQYTATKNPYVLKGQ